MPAPRKSTRSTTLQAESSKSTSKNKDKNNAKKIQYESESDYQESDIGLLPPSNGELIGVDYLDKLDDEFDGIFDDKNLVENNQNNNQKDDSKKNSKDLQKNTHIDDFSPHPTQTSNNTHDNPHSMNDFDEEIVIDQVKNLENNAQNNDPQNASLGQEYELLLPPSILPELITPALYHVTIENAFARLFDFQNDENDQNDKNDMNDINDQRKPQKPNICQNVPREIAQTMKQNLIKKLLCHGVSAPDCDETNPTSEYSLRKAAWDVAIDHVEKCDKLYRKINDNYKKENYINIFLKRNKILTYPIFYKNLLKYNEFLNMPISNHVFKPLDLITTHPNRLSFIPSHTSKAPQTYMKSMYCYQQLPPAVGRPKKNKIIIHEKNNKKTQFLAEINSGLKNKNDISLSFSRLNNIDSNQSNTNKAFKWDDSDKTNTLQRQQQLGKLFGFQNSDVFLEKSNNFSSNFDKIQNNNFLLENCEQNEPNLTPKIDLIGNNSDFLLKRLDNSIGSDNSITADLVLSHQPPESNSFSLFDPNTAPLTSKPTNNSQSTSNAIDNISNSVKFTLKKSKLTKKLNFSDPFLGKKNQINLSANLSPKLNQQNIILNSIVNRQSSDIKGTAISGRTMKIGELELHEIMMGQLNDNFHKNHKNDIDEDNLDKNYNKIDQLDIEQIENIFQNELNLINKKWPRNTSYMLPPPIRYIPPKSKAKSKSKSKRSKSVKKKDDSGENEDDENDHKQNDKNDKNDKKGGKGKKKLDKKKKGDGVDDINEDGSDYGDSGTDSSIDNDDDSELKNDPKDTKKNEKIKKNTEKSKQIKKIKKIKKVSIDFDLPNESEVIELRLNTKNDEISDSSSELGPDVDGNESSGDDTTDFAKIKEKNAKRQKKFKQQSIEREKKAQKVEKDTKKKKNEPNNENFGSEQDEEEDEDDDHFFFEGKKIEKYKGNVFEERLRDLKAKRAQEDSLHSIFAATRGEDGKHGDENDEDDDDGLDRGYGDSNEFMQSPPSSHFAQNTQNNPSNNDNTSSKIDNDYQFINSNHITQQTDPVLQSRLKFKQYSNLVSTFPNFSSPEEFTRITKQTYLPPPPNYIRRPNATRTGISGILTSVKLKFTKPHEEVEKMRLKFLELKKEQKVTTIAKEFSLLDLDFIGVADDIYSRSTYGPTLFVVEKPIQYHCNWDDLNCPILHEDDDEITNVFFVEKNEDFFRYNLDKNSGNGSDSKNVEQFKFMDYIDKVHNELASVDTSQFCKDRGYDYADGSIDGGVGNKDEIRNDDNFENYFEQNNNNNNNNTNLNQSDKKSLTFFGTKKTHKKNTYPAEYDLIKEQRTVLSSGLLAKYHTQLNEDILAQNEKNLILQNENLQNFKNFKQENVHNIGFKNQFKSLHFDSNITSDQNNPDNSTSMVSYDDNDEYNPRNNNTNSKKTNLLTDFSTKFLAEQTTTPQNLLQRSNILHPLHPAPPNEHIFSDINSLSHRKILNLGKSISEIIKNQSLSQNIEKNEQTKRKNYSKLFNYYIFTHWAGLFRAITPDGELIGARGEDVSVLDFNNGINGNQFHSASVQNDENNNSNNPSLTSTSLNINPYTTNPAAIPHHGNMNPLKLLTSPPKIFSNCDKNFHFSPTNHIFYDNSVINREYWCANFYEIVQQYILWLQQLFSTYQLYIEGVLKYWEYVSRGGIEECEFDCEHYQNYEQNEQNYEQNYQNNNGPNNKQLQLYEKKLKISSCPPLPPQLTPEQLTLMSLLPPPIHLFKLYSTRIISSSILSSSKLSPPSHPSFISSSFLPYLPDNLHANFPQSQYPQQRGFSMSIGQFSIRARSMTKRKDGRYTKFLLTNVFIRCIWQELFFHKLECLFKS